MADEKMEDNIVADCDEEHGFHHAYGGADELLKSINYLAIGKRNRGYFMHHNI